MKSRHIALIWLALLSLCLPLSTAFAQGTAFTYQGQLKANGKPTNGIFDLKFTLYAAYSGGVPVSGPVTNTHVATVGTNALFTTTVNFGFNGFTGSYYFLEVGVRPFGVATNFVTITPRQLITPVPSALFATAASNLSGTISASRLTGQIPGSVISGTIPPSQLPAGTITNGESGVNLQGTFRGNGTNLTGLNLAYVKSNSVLGWKTNWTGIFSPATTLQYGGSLSCVTAADVNGDGKMDLITAGGEVDVWTNAGDGTFSLYTTLPGTFSVAATDINGDGKMDIVTLNNSQNGFLIYTNLGNNLGFALASSESADTNLTVEWVFSPRAGVIWAVSTDINDISAASYLDVVGLNWASVINNDLGRFPRFVGGGAGGVYVVANENDNSLYALNQDGFPIGTATGVLPHGAAVADVNGDGLEDLISADWTASTLTISTNNGSGGFAIASTPVVGSGPRSVAAADINSDGYVDLISANSFTNTLTVLTNNGSGGFATAATLVVGNQPYCVITADLIGDGGVDLISANYDGTVSVFTNTIASISATFTSTFIGDGGGLTLNASLITSSVVDSSLSANVPRLNGTNLFTGPNQFTGGVIATNVNNVFGGDGSGLTNLNASVIVSGTVPLAQLPAAVVTTGAGGVTLGGTFSGDGSGLTNLNAPGVTNLLLSANISLLSRTNVFTGMNQFASVIIATNGNNILSGNGSGLSNLNASAISYGTLSPVGLPAPVVTNTASSVTLGGTFSGNGNGLTNLNGAALAGSVAEALISTNIPRLNRTDVFASVIIATNGNNILSGNGSGLSNLNASAISYGTLSPVGLPAPVVTNTASSVTLGGTFSGNGNGLTNLNGAGLTGSVADALISTNIPRLNRTNVFAGAIIAINGNNILSGNGSGMSNLNASAIGHGPMSLAGLPTPVVTNTASRVTLGGTFSGNGNGLTNLNGAGLAGSVADALISTNISRLNRTNVFAGAIIATNANNYFGGDGSGLTSLKVSAISIGSGSLSPAQLPMAVITNNNAASVTLNGTFSGDGSALTNIALMNVNGAIPAEATWSVVGNRDSGFTNPVVVIENTSTNSNAGPALRVLVDGGSGGTPDGALTVSANTPPGIPYSVLARFGNASGFVATITNDGTIYANRFVGDGSALTNLIPSSFTGTWAGDGGGLSNINATAMVKGAGTNLNLKVRVVAGGSPTFFFTNGILRAVQ